MEVEDLAGLAESDFDSVFDFSGLTSEINERNQTVKWCSFRPFIILIKVFGEISQKLSD